ncbi:MAG: diguanylate cyclase [Campylobacterota bacterium]|nr:diguanylate cyclase [Campylobacterota bacterium]
MKNRSNFFLLLVFILLSLSIVYLGNSYKNAKIKNYIYKQYTTLSKSMNNEVSTLIQEKQNATLSLAISFAQNNRLNDLLRNNKDSLSLLKTFSATLRQETDFKNVWLQLVDKDGISRARSWSSKYGDNLALIREDIRSMINKPEVKSTISVGIFDMSFKAMVPIFDQNSHYIGFIEVITHFNSIAKKIKAKQFEPVILVDKKYTKQIKHPFTKIFADDYYVANQNANRQLVSYIAKRGVESFISTNHNYIIDSEKNALVINYTLFNILKEPMANFLMFKPLESINFESVESMKSTINLFMLLAILVIGFLFYLLSNKEGIHMDTNTKRSVILFSFFFSLISLIYFLILQWNFEEKREAFLNEYNKNIGKDYQIIHKKFTTLADVMFQSSINKPEVLSLVAKAYDTNSTKAIARDKLYKTLIEDYEYFKHHDLRQLHFHLKNNESFLRFHRPEKYGDNLTDIRSTVEWVNTNHSRMDGFEEGRIYNGFRYVFPLVQLKSHGKKEHLGSVETSFSAYAIAKEYAVSHNTKAAFIITADSVNTKVFKEEKSNYSPSQFNGFLYETTIKKQLEHDFQHIDITKLDSKDIALASQKIMQGEIFSIQSHNTQSLFTFIPFKNPVTQKIVSAIILQQESMELNNQYNQFLILLFSGITSIIFIFLYIYKEFSSKEKFKRLSYKTQKLLDAQHSIVIITNGKKIIDANKQFLDFFSFTSLSAFQKRHECICEYFEVDDKFFHLEKVPKGEHWTTTLTNLPHKEHIVAMRDTMNKQHVFAMAMNQFDDNHILSFSDISDTMTEHFSLEQKVTHDKLTDAYNREYFNKIFPLYLQDSASKNLKLGIVFFDIDHFKAVNDTYGHNRGDVVLKHLVDIVHNNIRQNDVLVRWGGEEFLLIIEVKNLESLHKIAENLRIIIASERFEEINTLSCSFGITLAQTNESQKDTIERADRALYQAKNEGRNCVVSKIAP